MKEAAALLAFLVMTALGLVLVCVAMAALGLEGDPTNPSPGQILLAVPFGLYSAWSTYRTMAKKEEKKHKETGT